ncbi:MAG: RHS repeat domain-containing protein [Pseudobdellovibrio sp.]
MKNFIVYNMKKLMLGLVFIFLSSISFESKGSVLRGIFSGSVGWEKCVQDAEDFASQNGFYIELWNPQSNSKEIFPNGEIKFSILFIITPKLGLAKIKPWDVYFMGCAGVITKNSGILSSNNTTLTNNLQKDALACGSEIDYIEKNISESIPLDGSNLYLNYSSKFNSNVSKNKTINLDYNLQSIPANNLSLQITPKNNPPIPISLNLSSLPIVNLQYENTNNFGLTYSNEFKNNFDFEIQIQKIEPNLTYCYYDTVDNVLDTNTVVCGLTNKKIITPLLTEHKSIIQYKPEAFGLKGWTLSNHHYFDRISKTLFLGTGDSISYQNFKTINDSTYGAVDLLISKLNSKEIFIFDQTGKHLETKSAIFNKTIYKFNYQANNYLQSIDNQFNQKMIFQYDGSKNINKIIAFNGVETLINSDSSKINSTTDSLNQIFEMTYDDKLLLKTFKSITGVLTTFTYASNGDIEKEEKNNGVFQAFASYIISNFKKYTHTLSYGESNSVTVEMTFDGLKTTKYDEFGQTIYEKNNYYSSGMEKISFKNNTEESTFYSNDPIWNTDFFPMLKIHSSINESSQTITNTNTFYESRFYTNNENPFSLNYVVYQKNSDNSNNGSRIDRFEIGENIILNSVNEFGRNTVSYFYPNGLIKRIEPYNQYPSDFSYDDFGRLTKISKGTQFQSFGYDQYGYLNLVSNHKGQQTKYLRNSKGQILETTLANQDKINFEYTAGGEVKKITTPNNQVHQFQFDLGDYIHNMITPNNKQTVINYDSDKRVTDVQKPSGQSLIYVYKNGSQTLDRIKTSEGDLIFNQIDAQSRIRSLTSADNIKLNVDWVANQIQQQKWFDTDGSELATLTYNYYSDQFRIKDMLLNGQSFASYTYNKGRVQSINSKITYDYPRNFSYSDEVTTYIDNLTVADQRIDSVDGDKPSHIINATIKDNPELQLFLTLSRSYDNLGQATEFTTSTINTSTGVYNNYFSLIPAYDDNNRLIQITKTRKSYVDSTETNSIDFYNNYLYPPQSNNNIKEYSQTLSLTNPPVKRTIASHNNDDQLLQLNGSINRKYTYTDNGELKSMTNCYGTVNYEYDSFSNLKKITFPDGKIIEYKVDGFNRRVKKLVNGVASEYYIWYDQTRIAAILDSNKQPKLIYIYGPESSHSPSFIVKDNHTYKIIHDPGTGSIRYVVDPVNTLIMQELEYDEFGNMMKNTNPDFQPVTYTGGLYDKDTKFLRLGARDYDSTVGRWTTKDPIGFNGGDTNLYAYVGGDPMSYVDPSGLFGLFGGFNGQASTIGGSINGGGFAYLGEDNKGAGVGLALNGGATVVSVGASIGKGAFGGFYANTAESLLGANSFDVNTPIGGFSLYFNNTGSFEGISLGGPSLGLSFSFTPGENSVSINNSLSIIPNSRRPACSK